MRIGILGGGQLGRMLALAAHPLGHRVHVLAQSADEPACAVASPHMGSLANEDLIERFARAVDVVTYEFENVPLRTVDIASRFAPVRPGARSLEIASDRKLEKEIFRSLGIETAPFRPVDTPAELEAASGELGFPCVLKTRRLGYDGKGQRVLRSPSDVVGALAALGNVPSIVEAWVPFTRELSIVGVRSISGEVRTYPLVENEHREGILFRTDAPARGVSDAIAASASEAMRRLLEALEHVGVMALELFEVEGRILANEIAPRVHNTGHFGIEGAVTSQFENHLRAIAGDPLGDTSLRGRSVMINLVGRLPPRARILAIEGAHLHLYDKAPRPGRKLGHVTVTAETDAELDARVQRVLEVVEDVRDSTEEIE